MSKTWKTTQDFINNGSIPNAIAGETIVVTEGFFTPGDLGAAKWRKTGVSGLAVSQAPSDLGEAKLSDSNGDEWELLGTELIVEKIGGILDGVTDNSELRDVIITWSDDTGGDVIIGAGTFVCDQLILNDQYCSIRGLSQGVSVYKLVGGADRNCVRLTGTGVAELYAKNITFDQNSSNQTPALNINGIACEGCNALDLENVTIKNSTLYGIGLDNDEAKGCNWKGINIDGCGSSAIDIRDQPVGGESIAITGLNAKNYGLTTTSKSGLDIRGEVNAVNVKLIVSGENNGIKFSLDGWGVITNVSIVGDGVSSDLNGVVYDNDTNPKAVVSSVSMYNVFNAVVQEVGSLGGVLEGFVCDNVYGGNGNFIAGSDFKLSSGTVRISTGATRALRVESTAVNAQVDDVFMDELLGVAVLVRVTAGAVDTLLDGTLRGGTVLDSGTSTVDNMRII